MDQPKGIEVVKEAICKLKFNQQLRKSEGTKTPKVELTISIDGVAIQEPKTKTSPKVLQICYIRNIDVDYYVTKFLKQLSSFSGSCINIHYIEYHIVPMTKARKNSLALSRKRKTPRDIHASSSLAIN